MKHAVTGALLAEAGQSWTRFKMCFRPFGFIPANYIMETDTYLVGV